MSIVIDSNLLVALASGDSRGNVVMEHIFDWMDKEIDLHAPTLVSYEFANSLTRLIVAKAFAADKVAEAWASISILPIIYHNMADVPNVVIIAQKLAR